MPSGPDPGHSDDEDGYERCAAAPAPCWPPLPNRLLATPTSGPGPGGHLAHTGPNLAGPNLGGPNLGGPSLAGPNLTGLSLAGLNLALPWTTLADLSTEPGHLTRLGPISPAQARHLAYYAAASPATLWRVILTNNQGHALTTAAIPRTTRTSATTPATAAPASAPAEIGLISTVTLTITGDQVASATKTPGIPRGTITGRVLAAAVRAVASADQQATADQHADGCAHTAATPAYRPPPGLREHITARDLTCRFPTCRQPASRGDLDHTRPYDNGGLTCLCNLGSLCRTHHLLKHHPDWHLVQPAPGVFCWTTPAGRTYTTTPGTHPR